MAHRTGWRGQVLHAGARSGRVAELAHLMLPKSAENALVLINIMVDNLLFISISNQTLVC